MDEHKAVTRPAGVTGNAGTAARAKRIPAVAEALGYIGGALSLSAALALIATFWPRLGIAGHVGIGLAVAVAGLLGGYLLGRNESAAAQRLSQFLYCIGVAGVGVAVGFAVRDTLFQSLGTTTGIVAAAKQAAEWGWFAGSFAAALAGGIVWWRHRTVLQHLVFGCGVAAASLLVLPLVPVDGPDWGAGMVLVAVALAWGALTLLGRLTPRPAGLVLSALGISGGLLLTGEQWALWVGLLAAIALVWAGSRLEELAVLGIGTVSVMVFAGQIIAEYFGFKVGTSVALVTVGFVVLAVGMWLVRTTAPDASANRRVRAEVTSYLGIGLAMGGAIMLASSYWEELGNIGHVALPLVGAVVAYATAAFLDRTESGTARRLSQTLFGIGVLSVGMTCGVIVSQIAQLERWDFVAGAVGGAIAGAATWWYRKGAITQIALLSALALVVVSALDFAGAERTVPMWFYSGLLVVLGLVWVALGVLGRMVPVRTALSGGCVVGLIGFQMAASGGDGQGFVTEAAVLAILVGIGGIAASIYLKRAILLGFGALYVFTFSVALLMETFGNRLGAPIVMLVMGVVLIGLAVVVAAIAPRLRRSRDVQLPPQAA